MMIFNSQVRYYQRLNPSQTHEKQKNSTGNASMLCVNACMVAGVKRNYKIPSNQVKSKILTRETRFSSFFVLPRRFFRPLSVSLFSGFG